MKLQALWGSAAVRRVLEGIKNLWHSYLRAREFVGIWELGSLGSPGLWFRMIVCPWQHMIQDLIRFIYYCGASSSQAVVAFTQAIEAINCLIGPKLLSREEESQRFMVLYQI